MNNINNIIININYINQLLENKPKTKHLVTMPYYLNSKLLLAFNQPIVMFALECLNECTDEEAVICICLFLNFNINKKPYQFNQQEWNNILIKSGLHNNTKEIIKQKFNNIISHIVQNIKNYIILYKYPTEYLYIFKKNNKQKCYIDNPNFIKYLIKYLT